MEGFPAEPESLDSPAGLAAAQAQLGEDLGRLVSNRDTAEIPALAELALRNPVAYLNDIILQHLPEDLQDEWHALLILADTVARLGAPPQQADEAHSLEQLQGLVFDDAVDDRYRGTVADVVRNSSRLFCESIGIIAGNTEAYAKNIRDARAWLQDSYPEA